ncbi:related to DAD1 - essential subunit of the Dam1 complex [Ustilago trichophora]|uniref:DASH complex subunit DAD1 n=1 Tax=Ustilago trichophora TaxID=86804 RepID=A0A5C3EIU6_9BASI|nr:related to DAD1 - essential subunit of the Dam1 complex [Ustilago trichophora]
MQGVESILGNSNDLNRKLEESISVGNEFHPISQLWSKFEKVMIASGIPNLYPQSTSTTTATATTTTTAAAAGGGGGGSTGGEGTIAGGGGGEIQQASTPSQDLNSNQDAIRFETIQSTLPPGVAPGGGRIYAS